MVKIITRFTLYKFGTYNFSYYLLDSGHNNFIVNLHEECPLSNSTHIDRTWHPIGFKENLVYS